MSKRKVHKKPYRSGCMELINYAYPAKYSVQWKFVTCLKCLNKKPKKEAK